jgi:hypothetical protein
LLISLSIFAVTEAAAPPPPPPSSCTDQLILFSPCLSYVSSPPNNLTETPSTKCCDAFSSSFAPNSLCFCYLLRDDHILGFPLNSTRLLSLSSLCLSPPPTTSSLNFLCAGSFFLHDSFFSFKFFDNWNWNWIEFVWFTLLQNHRFFLLSAAQIFFGIPSILQE